MFHMQLQTTLESEGHGDKMPAELYKQQTTEIKQEVLKPDALLYMTLSPCQQTMETNKSFKFHQTKKWIGTRCMNFVSVAQIFVILSLFLQFLMSILD